MCNTTNFWDLLQIRSHPERWLKVQLPCRIGTQIKKQPELTGEARKYTKCYEAHKELKPLLLVSSINELSTTSVSLWLVLKDFLLSRNLVSAQDQQM